MKDCTRIDHSYTTIPEDFPKSVYTGKKGRFYADVLNDKVVSVPQGSEASFTFKAKNKHEESLFKIEDERYELDQAINLNADVIKVLEKAAKEIENGNGKFELNPKEFTRPRMSWIYQLCSKNPKMIELLNEHPAHTIPVILKTIKSFQADFKKKKEEMYAQWTQDSIKHWSRSLDHKRFNFCLNEKKTQVTKEFLIKMKQMMEQSKTLKDPEKQKEALEFFTSFDPQEKKALALRVSEKVNPKHPMLLEDPTYLEHFPKLPQFRFLFNDEECIRLVIKILYLSIENSSGQTHKQKNFLISFSKYFFGLGLVKENLKKLEMIEMPEALIDDIKDIKTFYKKWVDGDLKHEVNFNSFFFEEDKDVLVHIGTTREDSSKEIKPLRAQNGILESESEDESESEEEKEKNSNGEPKPFMNLADDSDKSTDFKNHRFLPQFMKDQVLFFGTRNYYTVLRFFATLYERIKLAKNIIDKKVRADIKTLKEEYEFDVTKLEEDFDKLVDYRFK